MITGMNVIEHIEGVFCEKKIFYNSDIELYKKYFYFNSDDVILSSLFSFRKLRHCAAEIFTGKVET